MTNYIQFVSFFIISINPTQYVVNLTKTIELTIELNNLIQNYIKFDSNLVYYLLSACTLMWTLFTLKLSNSIIEMG